MATSTIASNQIVHGFNPETLKLLGLNSPAKISDNAAYQNLLRQMGSNSNFRSVTVGPLPGEGISRDGLSEEQQGKLDGALQAVGNTKLSAELWTVHSPKVVNTSGLRLSTETVSAVLDARKEGGDSAAVETLVASLQEGRTAAVTLKDIFGLSGAPAGEGGEQASRALLAGIAGAIVRSMDSPNAFGAAGSQSTTLFPSDAKPVVEGGQRISAGIAVDLKAFDATAKALGEIFGTTEPQVEIAETMTISDISFSAYYGLKARLLDADGNTVFEASKERGNRGNGEREDVTVKIPEHIRASGDTEQLKAWLTGLKAVVDVDTGSRKFTMDETRKIPVRGGPDDGQMTEAIRRTTNADGSISYEIEDLEQWSVEDSRDIRFTVPRVEDLYSMVEPEKAATNTQVSRA